MVPVYTLEVTRRTDESVELVVLDTSLRRFMEEASVAVMSAAGDNKDLVQIAQRWIQKSWMNDAKLIKVTLQSQGKATFSLPFDNEAGLPMKLVVRKWNTGG